MGGSATVYLSWDGCQERTEKKACKKKRKAYEPTNDFVDMPITRTTKYSKILYFIKILGEPLLPGARLRYYKLS